ALRQALCRVQVEDEETARRQYPNHAIEGAAQSRQVGQVVQHVEGRDNQTVPAVHEKTRRIGLNEARLPRRDERRTTPARMLQHGRREVEPGHRIAGLEEVRREMAGAAAYVEQSAARVPRRLLLIEGPQPWGDVAGKGRPAPVVDAGEGCIIALT